MSIYEVRPQDHPSCHACGKGMIPTGYKCLSCGTTTEATMPENEVGDGRETVRGVATSAGWNICNSVRDSDDAVRDITRAAVRDINRVDENPQVAGGQRETAEPRRWRFFYHVDLIPEGMSPREDGEWVKHAEMEAYSASQLEAVTKERDELRTMFEDAFSCAKNAIRAYEALIAARHMRAEVAEKEVDEVRRSKEWITIPIKFLSELTGKWLFNSD